MGRCASLTAAETGKLLDLLASVPAGLGVDAFRDATLTFLLDVFGATSGSFFLANDRRTGIDIDTVATKRFDADQIRGPYKHYYQYLDPLQQRPMRSVGISCLSDFVPEERLVKSEYYNQFMKKLDVLHMLAICLFANDECIGAPVLYRPATLPNFSEAEKAKAARLAVYLGPALGRAMAAEGASQLNWILQCSLDEPEGAGMVVLDAEMNVILTNCAARRLLSLCRPEADPAPPGPELVLPEALANLCCRELRGPAPGGAEDAATAFAEVGALPLRVRLQRVSGRFFGELKRYLVVKFEAPGPVVLALDRALAGRFGLSPRELDVVQGVANGCSNADIADRLCVSAFTVRNHLQNIFRKVGVQSRTELVAKLLLRPALASPSPLPAFCAPKPRRPGSRAGS